VSLASRLLMAAIRGYKRHVSPRKGFACAYRIHLGACSCSTLGLRAISRYGAWRGLGVLQVRLQQCRLVAQERRARPFVARHAQAGFLDCAVPCDGACLDASACSCDQLFSTGGACEIVGCVDGIDCGDCGGCGDCGNWPWTRRRDQGARMRHPRRPGEPAS
jgi:uncharacterized protein